MYVDTRRVESSAAAEFYLTAVPSPSTSASRQGRDVFAAIRRVLSAADARILQERVFATAGSVDELAAARAEEYEALDDGTPPAWLAATGGATGPLSGVQVHAVRSDQSARTLTLGGQARGRVLPIPGGQFVTLSGLTAPEAGDASSQARAIFEKAEAMLRRVGGDMHSVARTWVWLEDILSWYAEFNRVRTGFFSERGLLNGQRGGGKLPASTGIGIGPAGQGRCALDVVAVVGAHQSFQHFLAAGRQDSAYKYGSAFSRALRTKAPAGEIVFISGTAAIDAKGATRHVGDIDGQIRMTIDNVRAVLEGAGCSDADMVQAIAYCKTPGVEEAFLKMRESLPWPFITTICDICREDLLFEIEAAASPGAKKA